MAEAMERLSEDGLICGGGLSQVELSDEEFHDLEDALNRRKVYGYRGFNR